MIILVCYEHENKRTKKKEILVSHGYDIVTGDNVILPATPVHEVGYFNQRIEQWVMKE